MEEYHLCWWSYCHSWASWSSLILKQLLIIETINVYYYQEIPKVDKKTHSRSALRLTTTRHHTTPRHTTQTQTQTQTQNHHTTPQHSRSHYTTQTPRKQHRNTTQCNSTQHIYAYTCCLFDIGTALSHLVATAIAKLNAHGQSTRLAYYRK